MYDLLEIIRVCRENDMKEYENKASYTNTDIGKVMIVYSTKTLHEKMLIIGAVKKTRICFQVQMKLVG